MELLIAVLFTLPLYVLPGLAFFQIFQFKNKICIWDRLAVSIFTLIIIISFTFTAVGNFFHFIPTPIHLFFQPSYSSLHFS